MSVKYEQDGSAGCVAGLGLWDEDRAEPFFTQEVVGPSILGYSNAVFEQKVSFHQLQKLYQLT